MNLNKLINIQVLMAKKIFLLMVIFLLAVPWYEYWDEKAKEINPLIPTRPLTSSTYSCLE